MQRSSSIRSIQQRVHRGMWLTAVVVLMAACASTPPVPVSSITAARESIARAEQADARRYSSTELDEAQRQLQAAERAVQAEDMESAERFALQSHASGELAHARTEFAKAQEVNRELALGLEALIEEMQRTGDLR